MNLKLYLNSAERNRIDKTNYLELLESMEGTLKNSTSITNPSILIERASGVTLINIVDDDNNDIVFLNDDNIYEDVGYTQDLLDCNYMYIPEFKRYYFIDDITSVSKNMWLISAHVDVLMSYNSIILNHYAFVNRNEYTYNEFIIDNLVNFKYEKEITYSDITNLSTVTTLTTRPSSSDNSCVISYLTDDTIYYSSSTYALDGLPLINLYATATNISTQYLTGTTGILYQLAKAVYKNDTLLSYIKNIMVYPFSIESFTDSGVNSIKIGSTSYTLTDTFKYPANVLDRVVIAHFQMDSAESFLDYSPYTVYDIFIPYYGYVSLSGESILGKELKIFYLINYDDGSSSVFIYNVTDNIVLFTSECTIGTKVLLSSTNALENKNQKNAISLNTKVNLIGSVLTAVGGLATGNAITTAGGVLKGASTIGNAISSYNQLYDIGSVGTSSASDGLSTVQKVFIKITRSIPVNYDSNYASLLGKPLNQYVKLSSLSGLTVVGSIHLENLSSATSNEYDEIETLLKTGIII